MKCLRAISSATDEEVLRDAAPIEAPAAAPSAQRTSVDMTNAVARCGSRRLANCSGVGNGGPIPSED